MFRKLFFPETIKEWNMLDSDIRSSEALHKKTYFPSLGISWKTQKDQENIIFPSTFWLKDLISHQRKVQNKNFSVISKYHLSINFLVQKKTVFPTSKKFKTTTFQ